MPTSNQHQASHDDPRASNLVEKFCPFCRKRLTVTPTGLRCSGYKNGEQRHHATTWATAADLDPAHAGRVTHAHPTLNDH